MTATAVLIIGGWVITEIFWEKCKFYKSPCWRDFKNLLSYSINIFPPGPASPTYAFNWGWSTEGTCRCIYVTDFLRTQLGHTMSTKKRKLRVDSNVLHRFGLHDFEIDHLLMRCCSLLFFSGIRHIKNQKFFVKHYFTIDFKTSIGPSHVFITNEFH